MVFISRKFNHDLLENGLPSAAFFRSPNVPTGSEHFTVGEKGIFTAYVLYVLKPFLLVNIVNSLPRIILRKNPIHVHYTGQENAEYIG